MLTLTMDASGKVSAKSVEGSKLTKASSTFLKATQDNCNIVVLKTDGDYRLDDGAYYRGGAYMGSKMADNGKMVGTNVVNPMVNESLDKISGIPEGVGILHDALEDYIGILDSPGSPPANSTENKKKGYDSAHKKAGELDSRYTDDNGNIEISNHTKQRNFENNKLKSVTEEVTATNKETKESASWGRFITQQ